MSKWTCYNACHTTVSICQNFIWQNLWNYRKVEIKWSSYIIKHKLKPKRSAPYTITSITDLVFYLSETRIKTPYFCQQFLLYYLHETPPSSEGKGKEECHWSLKYHWPRDIMVATICTNVASILPRSFLPRPRIRNPLNVGTSISQQVQSRNQVDILAMSYRFAI